MGRAETGAGTLLLCGCTTGEGREAGRPPFVVPPSGGPPSRSRARPGPRKRGTTSLGRGTPGRRRELRHSLRGQFVGHAGAGGLETLGVERDRAAAEGPSRNQSLLAEECEVMAFSPWNALAENRLMGGTNRLRQAVYLASQAKRGARGQ